MKTSNLAHVLLFFRQLF